MGSVDLPHFKRLLLEKRGELSSTQGDARALVPAAGGWEGDVIDQANADAEAELQIQLHRTDGRLARAIEEALVRIRSAHTACAKRADILFQKPGWTPFPGHASAASVRNASTRDSESGGGNESLRSCERGDGKGSRSCSTNRELAWRQDGECLLGCARHFRCD